MSSAAMTVREVSSRITWVKVKDVFVSGPGQGRTVLAVDSTTNSTMSSTAATIYTLGSAVGRTQYYSEAFS